MTHGHTKHLRSAGNARRASSFLAMITMIAFSAAVYSAFVSDALAGSPAAPFVPAALDDMTALVHSPGVSARTFTGASASIRRITIGQGERYASGRTSGETVLIVTDGTVRAASGSMSRECGPFDCLRFPPGERFSLETVTDDAEVLAFCLTDERNPSSGTPKPSPAGEPFPLNSLLFFRHGDGLWSRMIPADRGSVVIDRIAPGGELHMESEVERLILVLDGPVVVTTVNGTHTMSAGEAVSIPAGSPVSASAADNVAEIVTVMAGHAPDTIREYSRRLDRLRTIVPEDAKPELILDGAVSSPGLTFTEGPSWMNGVFYFSNYYRLQGTLDGRDEGGLCRIGSGGEYSVLNAGVQTCGTTPLPDGTLAACDLLGRRVIAMSPEGDIVRIIADSYNGAPLGMPNDCITDSRGGLYFTDPRGGEGDGPGQPGSAVYYVDTSGGVRPVTGWNEFNRPNGCLVSADGSTFYLGTREDTIWMFDIGDDGSLTNKRPFAELPPPVFPRDKDRGRGTIDRDGNVWIATNFGIQVFDRSGEYIGNVLIPLSPSHCAFGGDDLSTLYITSRNHIYRLRTTARGYQYPIAGGR